MSQENKKDLNISAEIRMLIRDGVYSFYQIEEGPEKGKYVLITDDRKIYLLSESGDRLKEVSELSGFKLNKVILDSTPFSQSTLKLNYI